VVTPHLGASTSEAQDRAGTDVAKSVLLALAGEFVPGAVNVAGGAVDEFVAPWLELVRKQGAMIGAIAHELPVSLEVQVRGELTAHDVAVLELSALRGVFSALTEDSITFVNAPALAKDRGISATVTTVSESPSHRSLVDVRAVFGDGRTVNVSGALTEPQQVQKIVNINGRNYDMRAEGLNLAVLNYEDRPGALGKIGTTLGAAGIDVQAAQLSQDVDQEGATMVLRVNAEVPADVQDAIGQAVGAAKVALVDLS
jgi:D-3-phosphoglycerate dehydrogenase